MTVAALSVSDKKISIETAFLFTKFDDITGIWFVYILLLTKKCFEKPQESQSFAIVPVNYLFSSVNICSQKSQHPILFCVVFGLIYQCNNHIHWYACLGGYIIHKYPAIEKKLTPSMVFTKKVEDM